MILSVKNLTINLSGENILDSISFSMKIGEKIAIVGRNGCGKSTLLKAIMNLIPIDKGEIYYNNSLKISYLSQVYFDNLNNTVEKEMLDVFKEVISLEQELIRISNELKENHDNEKLNKLAKLQNYFEENDGYTYNSKIRTVLFGLGFSENDLTRKINEFSGGQKTKIFLAKILLENPDLLLLDEPTNHLDIKAIEWLESFLSSYKKSIILVSHDRIFINRIVSRVLEIEYGKIYDYKGNYDSFLKQKEEEFEKNSERFLRQQKEIKRLEEIIEKFRFKRASFAQSKIKYLNRMEKIDNPQKSNDKVFKAKFKTKLKGGKNVLSLLDFQFGYDKKLGTVNLEILKGQRICVMGENGCGKSTLLKTIVDLIPNLGGFKALGHQIEIGYFDQQLLALNTNKTVLDELWDENPELTHTEIRTILGQFLFSADDVYKQVSVLSGGEKVRLALSKLMLKQANFLILDEPTNHLDILSKEKLEESLKEYDGTILFVSHDRYFIKKIATSVLNFENNQWNFYENTYKDYLEDKKTANEIKQKDTEKVIVKKPKQKYNIKKIEAEIDELEKLLEQKRDLRYEEEYYQDSFKMQLLNDEIDDIHNKIHNNLKIWEEAMEELENFKKM